MADFSETSGEENGSYFDGCLLNTMEILVKDIEKRSGEKLKEPYVVYMIETRCFGSSNEENQSSCLWRRYSEFDLLRNYLQATYPSLIIPPLPEKKTNLAAFRLNSDNYNMEFVERRRNGLEFFLHRIAKHPQLGVDEHFKSFLTQEEGWKESVIATGFQSKADSKLKSLSASFSVKKPDKKYEDIKNYSQTLQGNIASLLKVQQKIAEKQFNIHKEHANYGKIFSEWSSIEDEMGHALQKAGHYMDNLASAIDDIQEEEESHYVDKLKEYYLYADSIRVMTRKQQLRHYNLEKAEEALSAKNTQKEELVKESEESGEGKKSGGLWKGLSSKIFGGDTPEAREAKLQTLETQIEESENAVTEAKEELRTFTETASKDYDMFQKQRDRDINKIVIEHIKTQMKLCKLGVSAWENVKDTFEGMA